MTAWLILCIALVGFATPSKAQKSHSVSDSVRRAYTAGRYAETVSRLTAGRADSLSARAYYILGRSYQAREQHANAVRALESALDRGLQPSRGLPGLASSYAVLGHLDQAERLLKKAISHTQPARTPYLRLRLAEIYEKQRKWQEAGEIYRQRLSADSTNRPVRRRLAHVLVEQENTAEAIRHYQQLYHARQHDIRVAHVLSRLLLETEKYERTLRVTEQGLLQDSSHAGLWHYRANAAFKLDSLALAERAYTRTLQHGDTSTTVLQRLGIVRVGRKAYRTAIPPLNAAYRRDTTRAATHFYLGAALRGVGRPKEALVHFDRAVTHASEGILVDALTQAARTHDARDQLSSALHDYRTALRLRPSRADLYFHIAALYDSYYKDKSVPARYYRLFLRRSSTADTAMRSYADRRLKELRPTLHFQTDPNSP